MDSKYAHVCAKCPTKTCNISRKTKLDTYDTVEKGPDADWAWLLFALIGKQKPQ